MQATLTITINMDPGQMRRWADDRGIDRTKEAILADLLTDPTAKRFLFAKNYVTVTAISA